MAETQNQTKNTSADPDGLSAITSSTPIGDQRFFAPEDLTAPAAASYQTLSILSLLGFIIGGTFAAIVGLLAVIALFSGKPLLIAGWIYVFPLSAIVLCIVARLRISASEGTQAGASLANWGLAAALVAGLCGWAYQTAVFFALKQQSGDFVEEWLALVQDGELEKALLRTQPPKIRNEVREDDPRLGDNLSRIVSREKNGGFTNEISRFSQRREVRALLQAGRDARIESRGIKAWEYIGGGYRVVWSFAITTPELEFDVEIGTHGVDSPNADEGRVWTITGFDIADQGQAITATPFGMLFARRIEDATRFASKWLRTFEAGELLEAFLQTLPEERRAAAGAELGHCMGIGLVGGAGAMPLVPAKDLPTLEAHRRFAARAFVALDDKRFFGTPTVREVLTPVLREELARPSPGIGTSALQFPPLRIDSGPRFQLEFTSQIIIPVDPNAKPTPQRPRAEYHAEILLQVEGDSQALEKDTAKPAWRVIGIKVIGGRQVTGPPPQLGPQPPRPPS